MLRAPLFKGTTAVPGARGAPGAGKADASWAVSQDALWVTLEHPICPVLAAPVQALAEGLCRHQAALASLTTEEAFLSALPGSAPTPWEQESTGRVTLPTHKAFAGLFQGDPAWSCKAHFLWHMWLLVTTGKALTPLQSPCASVPASEQC